VTTSRFIVDGLSLAVSDSQGAGNPIVFQHGLCGDARQAAEVFPEEPSLRRVTLECRGHGQSDTGDLSALSLATFARDLESFIDERFSGPVILGGISMGAALALQIAVRRPHQVAGLILARPAWGVTAAPANMQPYAMVGQLLSHYEPARARAIFEESCVARLLAAEAPDNLASLRSFFTRQSSAVTGTLLASIAKDGPGVDWPQVERITAPTLVIGHGRDAAHPFACAVEFSRRISSATLVQITAKADDPVRYLSDFREALWEFLRGITQ
jgi:pimeloyl-ACP methyl ester carboxylesterase